MKTLGTLELDAAIVRVAKDPAMQLVRYGDPQIVATGPGSVDETPFPFTPAGIRIYPKCHPGAHFMAVYERPAGVLVLACATCGGITSRIAVGSS